jgi:hypothetical protein
MDIKWHKYRIIINHLSPVGDTKQRMGKHGLLGIPEEGSGAKEE